jgi:hypothetical protein
MTKDDNHRAAGSFKLSLLETLNGDPRLPPTAIKVILSYLPFITDPDKDNAYRSNVDLQVDTGLGGSTIRGFQKLLVSLDYMETDGATATGCMKYKVKLTAANVRYVADQKLIAKAKLQDANAARKEAERKKKAERAPDSDTPSNGEGARIWTPRAPDSDTLGRQNLTPSNLYDHLEDHPESCVSAVNDAYGGPSASFEPIATTVPMDSQGDSANLSAVDSNMGEKEERKTNLYAAMKDGEIEAYPIPTTESDLTAFMKRIVTECGNLDSEALYEIRRKFMAGELTDADIDQARKAAA